MVHYNRAGNQAVESSGISGFNRGNDKDFDVGAKPPDLQQFEDDNRAIKK